MVEPIEELDGKDFIQHDFEKRLIWKKINELIRAFNKSCTPQTPKESEESCENS